MREVALDAVRVCERDISNRYGSKIEELSAYLKTNVTQMQELTTKSAAKLQSSTKHIKQVCANYFQKYELDLEE